MVTRTVTQPSTYQALEDCLTIVQSLKSLLDQSGQARLYLSLCLRLTFLCLHNQSCPAQRREEILRWHLNLSREWNRDHRPHRHPLQLRGQ